MALKYNLNGNYAILMWNIIVKFEINLFPAKKTADKEQTKWFVSFELPHSNA